MLLEQAWRDLFLLTAVEQEFHLNLTDLESSETYRFDLEYLQEILNQCRQMQMNSTELICLKSFVLFKTELKSFDDPHTIASLHEQAQLFLQTYLQKQYPSEANRFVQLLSLISSFRFISPLTIEEIFFRKTIGDQIQMKQLVKDMFKMIVNA